MNANEWNLLNDDDRIEILNSMPDYMDGFCKTWGWLNFSKATEEKIIEKNRHLITHPAKTLTQKEIADVWFRLYKESIPMMDVVILTVFGEALLKKARGEE